jgi:hypothetical protein
MRIKWIAPSRRPHPHQYASQIMNPFKIGDKVIFAPDERAGGWQWLVLIARIKLKPGDVGIITQIAREDRSSARCRRQRIVGQS